ncbi:MAG: hemerythrin domain-containing protein [Ruminiclostridium sp.]
MNSIDLMVEEHKNILAMLKVVRKACHKILQGDDICFEDFEKIMDFIRNYADAHHHGKEEKFLFKEMVANLGDIGNTLINHGMLVEHNLGRLYISELSEALQRVKAGDEESKLDVIANAVGYVNLLTRHIAKEDDVVYTFAARKLPIEVIDSVNQRTEDFEQEAESQGIQVFYKELLGKLEYKYLTQRKILKF